MLFVLQQETRQLLVQVIAADAQAALAAATAAVQRPKGAEDVEDVDTSGVCRHMVLACGHIRRSNPGCGCILIAKWGRGLFVWMGGWSLGVGLARETCKEDVCDCIRTSCGLLALTCFMLLFVSSGVGLLLLKSPLLLLKLLLLLLLRATVSCR